MTTHDAVRPLLALSAAGLLEPGEERHVREHVRECAPCAAELDALAELGSALAVLPQPALPPDLPRRAASLLAAELALQADRRRGAALAVAGCLFAWMATVVAWAVYEILTGGAPALLRPDLSSLVVWLALSAVSVCVAAPAAAMLAARRRLERSV